MGGRDPLVRRPPKHKKLAEHIKMNNDFLEEFLCFILFLKGYCWFSVFVSGSQGGDFLKGDI